MFNKIIGHHFKVSVLIMLAIASTPFVFQSNIYGQEGSERQSRAVFIADLEARTASNATGIGLFEIVGGDTMSYTINASGTANFGSIFLS
jgi:hypothetical protein